MAKKRAMSSEHARSVKLSGHTRERLFANSIGLGSEYKHDGQAKKDVIDFNGDCHSIKSGTWWQIFLYRSSRIENDYGFKAMNGMGELILSCLNVFLDNRDDYLKDKDKYKNLLQKPMKELCLKLQDKNRLQAFLSKSIFNGGEVSYLTIFENNDDIHVFYYRDVVDVLSSSISIDNSKAKSKGQFDNQKVLFKYDNKNIGEIEVRNDSKQHYKEIKFRLNAIKTLDILKENIKTSEKPNIINKIKNDSITCYGQAIKKFK